jgi:MFS family permease
MSMTSRSRRDGVTFWLVFVASSLECTAFSATAPVIPRYVERTFDGGPAAVGLLVALAALTSLVVQPLAGYAADRLGYRRIAMLGCVLAIAGMALTVLVVALPSTGLGRILFGAGGASLATATGAWVAASVPHEQRGRAFSIYGLSVWIGLALGPVVGENVFQGAGFTAVWLVCGGLMVVALGAVVLAREPEHPRHVPGAAARELPSWASVVVAVSRPGTVAALAWSGEAVLVTYLVLHLEERGLPTSGVLGAASIFTVFAASVVASRLVLSRLVDRIDPRHTSAASLVLIGTGLLTLAFTSTFWLAAACALLLGFAFAPLYPSLVLLVTDRLDPARRATGLGTFNSFTSLGLASGGFVGGIVSGWWGAEWAFVIAAAAQLVAVAVVLTGPATGRQSAMTTARDSV